MQPMLPVSESAFFMKPEVMFNPKYYRFPESVVVILDMVETVFAGLCAQAESQHLNRESFIRDIEESISSLNTALSYVNAEKKKHPDAEIERVFEKAEGMLRELDALKKKFKVKEQDELTKAEHVLVSQKFSGDFSFLDFEKYLEVLERERTLTKEDRETFSQEIVKLRELSKRSKEWSVRHAQNYQLLMNCHKRASTMREGLKSDLDFCRDQIDAIKKEACQILNKLKPYLGNKSH